MRKGTMVWYQFIDPTKEKETDLCEAGQHPAEHSDVTG
jgi:hypothetical protein